MTSIPNEKRAKLRFRMSKQQKLDPKKNSDQIYKGSHLMFLTPDRKLPPLKTTFTRPQNVSLADLSPFYRQTRNPLLQDSPYSPLTSPILSKVSKSNTDAKSGNCDEEYEHDAKNDTGSFHGKVGLETPFERHLKETYVGVTKTHDKQKENSETVKSYASNTLNDKHTLDLNNESFKKMDIVGIEMQIIPENEVDVEKSPLSLSDFTSHSNVGEDRFQSKLCEPESSERQHGHNSYSGNQTSRNIDSGEGRRRRYTPSFCSSCSCEDSMIAQSRCSVCDGCSTSTCNSSYSSIEPSHARPSSESVENYFHPFEMSATKIDHLLDSHLSFEELDAGLLKSLSEEVNESKAKENPCKLPLSTEQLIFLLLRIVLAKYKCLTDDIAREKRTSKSQRQSIAYLIQAVIFLSRRVKSTSDQWHKTQIQLQAIQTDYSRLRKQTRKIMAVCCVLVILNVCRIPSVKQRIIKIVKLFGFVENVRKINRMRKMVAENWRNIPSLLTDFWRIFIFRSTTKLKNA